MNEDVIADLKQFIAATVSQNTANTATKQDIQDLDSKLTNTIDGLESKHTNKLDNLSEFIADAFELNNEALHSPITTA